MSDKILDWVYWRDSGGGMRRALVDFEMLCVQLGVACPRTPCDGEIVAIDLRRSASTCKRCGSRPLPGSWYSIDRDGITITRAGVIEHLEGERIQEGGKR